MAKPHTVRSGALTRVRVEQICRWVERLPNDLPKVARACLIYPADLLYWFALGQTYDCPQPLAAELAWRVNVIRAKKASVNQKRIERGARGGRKVKEVFEIDPDTKEPILTEKVVEAVLPAQWAIERLEQQAAESSWELSPNDDVARDLVAAFEATKATPLLSEGRDREADAETRAALGADEQSATAQAGDTGVLGGVAAAAPETPGNLGGGAAYVVRDEGEDAVLRYARSPQWSTT